MLEIEYKGITVYTENKTPLSLSYLILVEQDRRPQRYGVKIVEQHGGDLAQIPDLTTNIQRVYHLVDKLAKHAVTPTTLADVVADWL